MKTLKLIIGSAILIVLCLSAGCNKPNHTPSAQSLLTSGTWKLKSATVDGTSTALYDGLTITFTNTAYTTTNGKVEWPATDTYKLSSDGKTITRGSDNLSVYVSALTSTSLTLSYLWAKTTLNGGRTESIAGNTVLTFGK